MDEQQRIAEQDGNHTPTECPPLAVALALVLLPLADDPRIDADAGIVQKNAPVDFTDIDPKHLPEIADHPFWKTVTQSAMRTEGGARDMASGEN